jgi:RNA-directed DNA polymerase
LKFTIQPIFLVGFSDKLLEKLKTFPSLGRQIKAWLTAGMMDGSELFANQAGVPQGGLCKALHNV